MFLRDATPPASAKYEHERLTSLINSMADGVIAVDEHCRVQLYNGAALNILDVNSSMRGHQLGTVLKPIDKDNQTLDIKKVIEATKTPTTNRDLRLTYKDGSTVNLFLNISPVHLGYGATGHSGYVLILRDITREKSLEEERDEFISVVSHELRTPIAIAEGNISNAQFIADKTEDAAIKKALAEAHTQVLFLADLINDLSTLSRAERGILSVETEDIDVAGLILELQNTYAEQAGDKGLKLVGSCKGKPVLKSSRLYVREVLQNFITNALKYTEKGSVHLTAHAIKDGTVFTVTDTGIGISKNDQKRVFDKFFRSEDYRTRSTNGTGLGLYVTSKLARLLRADIQLTSELNHGSTFTITIPDHKPE
jgi:PAS domain S-box-containing protein